MIIYTRNMCEAKCEVQTGVLGAPCNLEPPYSALNIDVALSKSNDVCSDIQTINIEYLHTSNTTCNWQRNCHIKYIRTIVFIHTVIRRLIRFVHVNWLIG
jgi:hypothetical protein